MDNRLIPIPGGASPGQPTKYKEEFNQQAYKLCLLGFTDAQLARFFEVSDATVDNWKRDYPEFLSSVKAGKDIADAEVSAAMFKRATGFIKEGIEQLFHYQGEVIRAETSEYYPPDTGAAMNWLKNRQRDLWKDKQGVEFEKMSDEDLDRLYNKVIASLSK